MKIVEIVPGSGGTFYCENCMRDSALTRALRQLGHDVIMVPMYLPVFADEPNISGDVPVFFGGINVYLQQKFALFRKTPRWVDKLLDARWLLNLAARQAGTTDAAAMGEMTLSMIRGEDGHQAKELERLVTWLATQEKPDLVHISTIMLIGLARRIRETLGVPVVCSAMDEDMWIDAHAPPYPDLCWDAIAERTGDIQQFVTVSDYYRDDMRKRLNIAPDRITTVRIGIDLSGYTASALPMDPPVIGYLSKVTPSLGFETLLDAVLQLRAGPFPSLQLRAMGGVVGADKPFVACMYDKARAAGAEDALEIRDDVSREQRQRFLEALTLLSVPMPGGEAYGTFMVEAWAAGVPCVQPGKGAFPELLQLTGGGLTYSDNSPGALADAIAQLLHDPARVRAMGQRARDLVHQQFGIEVMAQNTARLYEHAIEEAQS